MFKLSEKSRKILRAIYRGIGASALSLSLTACPPLFLGGMYGPGPDPGPDDENLIIRGYVRSNEDNKPPIKGIAIVIPGVTGYISESYTHGEFYLYVPKLDNYTIIFTDVDKENNGGLFKQYIHELTLEEALKLNDDPLIIYLNKDTD